MYTIGIIIIINQKLNMLTFDTVVFCDILLGGAGVSIFLGGRFGGSILRPLVSGSKQQVRCLVKETHQLHCTLMCPKKRAGFGPLAYSRPVSHPTRTSHFEWLNPRSCASSSPPLCASTSSLPAHAFHLILKDFGGLELKGSHNSQFGHCTP